MLSVSFTPPNKSDLRTLVNVGPAVTKCFRHRNHQRRATPRTRPTRTLRADLCYRRCAEDTCLLETLMSAVDQADGAPGQPWWHYTAQRKKALAEAGRMPTFVEAQG
ncbi:helix-hairpin-helix domain-containing protein [Naumannella cuiyingiana]|uniref:helix-hairpin-helix domain-containing protein n=1 Tax=Naumannella cuiyingiana TaxID=1347891 RepID=UPI003CCD96C1